MHRRLGDRAASDRSYDAPMRARHPCFVSLLWLALGMGCETEPPVLTGIPDRAILTPREAEAPASPKRTGAGYEKSADVLVDARHLGGKRFTKVRDLIADQLGQLTASRELDAKKGRELTFERGTIRIVNGSIYMLRVPLPFPMRRSEALETLGFPPYVGGYTGFHREYRLHNEWGFRRIRMKRENRHSERVTQVEAWRWLPGERGPGR
jgi:hypothetical protein